MLNFFDSLVKYWAIITWVIGMIFTMGVMWVKVDTSQTILKKLFEQMDDANKFIGGQEIQNKDFKEQMAQMITQAKDHRDDDNQKFGELRGRMDQIFALLMKGS